MMKKNILLILVVVLMASLVLAEPVFYITTDKDSYGLADPIVVTVGVNKELNEDETNLVGVSIGVSQDFGDSFKDQAEVVDLGEQALYLNPLISMVSASKPYRWKYSSPVVNKIVNQAVPLFRFQISGPHLDGTKELDLVNSYYFNSDLEQVPINIDIKNICVGNDVDVDADQDGVCDVIDNCPLVSNGDQEDSDEDGAGNACDDDDDNDGVVDEEDNCPLVANADGQGADGDQDGIGDACDLDSDNDGVNNDEDNCPFVENPDQANFDGDPQGDACDMDQDDDGVVNEEDDCQNTPENEEVDLENGCSDSQEQDSDGDGINDGDEQEECVYDPDNDGVVNAMPIPEGLDSPNVFTEGPFVGCIKGDLNLDDAVNADDISWFIQYYGDRDNYDPNEPLPVDLNIDEGVTSSDITEFIDAYAYR